MARRFRRTGSMASRKILDEVVLVPIRTDARAALAAYHLNRTAALLWELLEHDATLDELAGALCDRFQVEAGQAQDDAEAFCAEMLRIGALEHAGEGEPGAPP